MSQKKAKTANLRLIIASENKSLFLKIFQSFTANNTAVSPNFLMWKFCGKVQNPHQEIR